MSFSRTKRFQDLIHREDKVLSMMHAPTAFHGRIMEAAGAEALFVGTSLVIGTYTGLADVGVASMTECVTIGGWIARSVGIPVMLDGDTGHGGIMAVRRLVKECIQAGIAGVRIDDQPIEGKRRTESAGIEVIPLEQALARYRAAVDMKNELDPNFVIMAQCYARGAVDGNLEDTLVRLNAYKTVAGVDWVQLECPYSVDEIKQARSRVPGPFSFIKGKLASDLDFDEHLALGINIAWHPSFSHQVTWAALWDFMNDYRERGLSAWTDFQESRKGRTPYPDLRTPQGDESLAKLQELEARYRVTHQPKGADR